MPLPVPSPLKPEADPASLDARIDSARRFGHDFSRLAPSRDVPPAAAPASGSVASGVVQRAKGTYGKRKRSRHRVIRRHLERAQNRTNASEVSLIVFHNGERVFSTPAIRKSQEDEPSTSLVHARRGEDQPSLSKDGELFLIDQLNSFLPGYVKGIKESYDHSGKYQTYPSFDVSKGQSRHAIRIEVVGPKGTCEDCQEALGRYLKELQTRHSQTSLGAGISYKINTRWTGYKTEKPGPRVLGGRLDKGMSPWYGSRIAKPRRNLGLHYVPEHYKFRVRASHRTTHRDFQRPAKRRTTGAILRNLPKGQHIVFED